MNIVEKKNIEKDFEDLEVGECFKYEGDYFLKIEEWCLDCDVNAVDIHDGITASFDKKDKVISVPGSFIIL